MKKFKIITTHKKLLADTTTPVSIYLRLRDVFPNSLLLESSDYHSRENSTSYICCEPISGLILNDGNLKKTYPDSTEENFKAGEFELLLAFVERPRRVLSRDQLLDLSRGRSANAFDRSIDVQVSRLRRKIEPDPKEPTLIKTVRSGGYLFTPTVTPIAGH